MGKNSTGSNGKPMIVKILWVLIGVNALAYAYFVVGTLLVGGKRNSDDLTWVYYILGGMILLLSAVPILLSHKPVALFFSGFFAVLPIVLLVVIFLDKFVPPQKGVSRSEYSFYGKRAIAIATVIEWGDTASLRERIKGENLNKIGKDGITYLSFALQCGQTNEIVNEMVQILIDGGADPNRALLHAVYYGKPETLTLFFNGGADPNLKDFEGESMIFRAIYSAPIEILVLMVAKGARLNSKDSYGWTPVMRAAEKDLWRSVLYLLETGADYQPITSDGKSLIAILGSKLQNPEHRPALSPDLAAVVEWFAKKEIEIK